MKRSAFLRRKTPSKCGNSWSRSTLLNRSFQSAWERDRAEQLAWLEREGVITELTFQPKVLLTRAGIVYHPDFRYREDGKVIWEEVKGWESEAYQLKEKLWRVYGPGELRVTKKATRGKFITTKTIHPNDNEHTDATPGCD